MEVILSRPRYIDNDIREIGDHYQGRICSLDARGLFR